MTGTLVAMTPALIVLFILGTGTLALGWWLSVKAENRDSWLFGGDDPYPFTIVCPSCSMLLSKATHPGDYNIRLPHRMWL